MYDGYDVDIQEPKTALLLRFSSIYIDEDVV